MRDTDFSVRSVFEFKNVLGFGGPSDGAKIVRAGLKEIACPVRALSALSKNREGKNERGAGHSNECGGFHGVTPSLNGKERAQSVSDLVICRNDAAQSELNSIDKLSTQLPVYAVEDLEIQFQTYDSRRETKRKDPV